MICTLPIHTEMILNTNDTPNLNKSRKLKIRSRPTQTTHFKIQIYTFYRQFCIAFSDVTCFSMLSQQNIDKKLYRLRVTHYARAFRDTRLSELHVLTRRQK